jgi:hypothetical protein
MTNKQKRIYRISKKQYKELVKLTVFSLILTACARLQPTPVELSLKVEPVGQPGTYRVSGTTNLPDQSQISISGIRYLNSQSSPSSTANQYSILAHQNTRVVDGKWQAVVNLWQVAPDGRYQEAWQLNQSKPGSTGLKPAEQVLFTAVFEPGNQTPSVQQQLKQNPKKLDGSLIQTTSEGQPYLQISQIELIGLPTGKTTPPSTTANVTNLDHRLVKREVAESGQRIPSLPKERQTNAPLTSAEFLH